MLSSGSSWPEPMNHGSGGGDGGRLELTPRCPRGRIAGVALRGLAAAATAVLLGGCSIAGLSPTPSPAAALSSSSGSDQGGSAPVGTGPDTAGYVPPPAGSCHPGDGGDLPDPACTPGARDPRVTPGDIRTTICSRGYTDTVRPPVSVTEPIKRERMKAYAVALSLSQIELDHLIPLELGGASTIQNLWPEPWDGARGAHSKDDLENALNHLVCAGQLDLATAQRAISSDWETAYRRYVGSLPSS